MSSHREAPQISKDPVADSTDLYAFMSPDRPGYVTIIANYIPLQGPDAGPNFYEFGDDVVYDIHVDNNGDGRPDVTYRFQFDTVVNNPGSFLYNTGPISSLSSANWNRRQFVTVSKVVGNRVTVLGESLPCPPCNVGPLSMPDYGSLAAEAVHTLSSGETVFCGQRADGFYVDLGAIFDLGNLRPFQFLNNFSPFTSGAPGVQSLKALNVHSIALQVPASDLTGSTAPVIGVWTAASRQQVRLLGYGAEVEKEVGPWLQVSRLGNPLINEVIIPMGTKDYWNGTQPHEDAQFAEYYAHPELADLLPVLYHAPGSTDTLFPNLAALNASGAVRADLEAILLTGIPSGIIPGFQNYTGSVQADMLRLNTSIPASKSPSNLGLMGGDAAGFPNGRRVFDDIVTIELRAVAGALYGLVATYTPDAAATEVAEGLTTGPTDLAANGTENYLSTFPYLGVPYSGYSTPAA
ncbi:MAG TPA: DUF4331 domain-containing protein [Acidimicrobiales bacterium]|nr:DUF4331 domain-containing protein [Acidimicrobiales bacterium]